MFDQDYLFLRFDLRERLHQVKLGIKADIRFLSESEIMNADINTLKEDLLSSNEVRTPRIFEEKIEIDKEEVEVDVSRDYNRYIPDPSQPSFITGTRITYRIPFTGDGELFEHKSSLMSLNPPRGVVEDNELLLLFDTADQNSELIEREFNNSLSRIKQHLKSIENDISVFKDSLQPLIIEEIEKRRQKLINDKKLIKNLGYPLKRRGDAPATFSVPVRRRGIKIRKPSNDPTPSEPKPTLELKEYENILNISSSMVSVIERSPNSFKGMEEEDLRNHFLVQLNGQYEGQATGETFNAHGKTDILIRVENKNIFIAECKFWRGSESLNEAITQILNYTSWRDTKTAIFLFNRTKNLTSVLKKIPTIVKANSNFKRELEYKAETAFRYIFNHKNDEDKDLVLTILVFEVPN